ncbi:MAG: T9SS type A sorting domain-containing protein [Bacteroidales bacterium]|nr:MAG: T9SS type A sorting domain-containing protein [Bacteroidales bacterium]
MKRQLKLFCLILIVTAYSSVSAQNDFTVTIPSTDKYGELCKPAKANVGFKLSVLVKSNISDTCKISIDSIKTFITYLDWFDVDKKEQTIVRNQTDTFKISVLPPAGIQDGMFDFNLYFDVLSKSNVNRDFAQNRFVVIVDNSAPYIRDFYAPNNLKTSTSLQFLWSAFDLWSSYYTQKNDTSGVSGIARYSIVLKNLNNQVVGSQNYDANEVSNGHTFTGLASNTEYVAFLTAIDVAGNQKTSNGVSAITPPAAPANLSSASLTYCGANLTWNPSPGATSYSVYRKIGTTSLELYGTTNSPTITITGLNNNTAYNFSVIAHGIGGTSDYSNVSFTTLAVPRPEISGSALVCSSNSIVNAINLPPDCSVIWGKSDNLTITSSLGSTANISYSGNGLVWLDATYNSCGGNGPQSGRKDIWFGKPLVSIISEAYYEPLAPGVAIIDNELADPYGVQYVNQVNWSFTGPLTNFVGGLHKAQFRAGRKPGIGVIYATSQNGCGSVNRSFGFEVGGSSYRTTLHPNPASTEVTVSVLESDSQAASRYEISNETIDYVKIYDLNGNLKKTLQCKGSRSATVNVSGLREGTYILEAGNSKFSEKQQILVRK